MTYPTLFEAACSLYRRGFRWENDYERFTRGSWQVILKVFKNGKCKTVTF